MTGGWPSSRSRSVVRRDLFRNPRALSAYMFVMMANFTPCAGAAIALLLAGSSPASGQTLDKLQLHKVLAAAVEYHGTKAIHVTQTPGAQGEDTLAIVSGLDLRDGVIEVDLAGAPAPGRRRRRGFDGLAFRVQPNAAKFELLYLRPTNGRAEDQLRRNHSTQYVSFPDWPWRAQETPGLCPSPTWILNRARGPRSERSVGRRQGPPLCA